MRAFSLLTHRFKLTTREFEPTTRRFKLVTLGFELVTSVLLFHYSRGNKTCCFLYGNIGYVQIALFVN